MRGQKTPFYPIEEAEKRAAARSIQCTIREIDDLLSGSITTHSVSTSRDNLHRELDRLSSEMFCAGFRAAHRICYSHHKRTNRFPTLLSSQKYVASFSGSDMRVNIISDAAAISNAMKNYWARAFARMRARRSSRHNQIS